MTRWQTFYLMACQVDLRSKGILKPSDLIPFPWDDELSGQPISDDEAEDLLGTINDIRKSNTSKKD